MFGVRLRDTNCALKVVKGDVLRGLRIEARGYPTPTEICLRLAARGCRLGERGVTHRERAGGREQAAPLAHGLELPALPPLPAAQVEAPPRRGLSSSHEPRPTRRSLGVILAAGKGTRIQPFSERYPKPILPILGKPLLQHQIECLRELGVRRVIIVIGHLGLRDRARARRRPRPRRRRSSSSTRARRSASRTRSASSRASSTGPSCSSSATSSSCTTT